MPLDIDTIFPCPDQTYHILEPTQCTKIPLFPTVFAETESKVVFRKRVSKGSYRFQYVYEDLMLWEYLLIDTFFKARKGRFDEFYLVDWSLPFHIISVSDGNTTIGVNHLSGVTASIGYGGNQMLIYNPRFDPRNESVVDKFIGTIESIDEENSEITFTEAITSALATSASMAWILYPALFDTDTLAPTRKESCIEKRHNYFHGYGNKYITGPIMSINVPFMQIGVMADA